MTAFSTEGVKSPAFNETFHDAAVDDTRIHAAAEVGKRRKRASLPANLRDFFNSRFADILDGCEAKADSLAINAEIGRARIDIWRQNLDAHTAAELDVRRDLRRIHDAREHRGHEFGRIMGFEIGRLPRDESIGRTVRLIEAIVGKMCQEVKNRISQPHFNVILLATIEEIFLLGHQNFMLFLAHGAAQEICLTERKARKHLHNLHDLLLIEHNAKSFLKNRLQKRMHISNFLFAMTAGDEILDHAAAERPRTVEGHKRDEVGEVLRCEVAHELGHTGRLHLEHGARLALTEHLRRHFVRQRDFLDIDLLVATLLDIGNGIADDSQCAQAEEVHF